MRVTCPHCLSNAVITSTNRVSERVTDLYCQCSDTVECTASFVFTLGYKKTLKDPVLTPLETVMNLVNALSEEEKAEMKRRNLIR